VSFFFPDTGAGGGGPSRVFLIFFELPDFLGALKAGAFQAEAINGGRKAVPLDSSLSSLIFSSSFSSSISGAVSSNNGPLNGLRLLRSTFCGPPLSVRCPIGEFNVGDGGGGNPGVLGTSNATEEEGGGGGGVSGQSGGGGRGLSHIEEALKGCRAGFFGVLGPASSVTRC